MTVEETGQGGLENNSQGEGTGINPAWNDVMAVIPEELHSQVTPHFQNWDKGVQTKLQEVHSKYEPYKSFVDRGVDAGYLEQGYGLLNALQNDPMTVVTEIARWANIEPGVLMEALGGSTQEQGLGSQTPEQSQAQQQQFDLGSDSNFKQMQEQLGAVTQFIVAQRQQQEQQEANATFERELSEFAVKNHGGEFAPEERQFIIGWMLANEGSSLDDAYKAYQSVTQRILNGQPKPPVVQGAGGSYPSKQTDYAKLNSKDTRALIVDSLLAAQRAEQ